MQLKSHSHLLQQAAAALVMVIARLPASSRLGSPLLQAKHQGRT